MCSRCLSGARPLLAVRPAPSPGPALAAGAGPASADVSDLAGATEPCTLTFEIRVFDRGDSAVDSAALIDNLRFE